MFSQLVRAGFFSLGVAHLCFLLGNLNVDSHPVSDYNCGSYCSKETHQHQFRLHSNSEWSGDLHKFPCSAVSVKRWVLYVIVFGLQRWRMLLPQEQTHRFHLSDRCYFSHVQTGDVDLNVKQFRQDLATHSLSSLDAQTFTSLPLKVQAWRDLWFPHPCVLSPHQQCYLPLTCYPPPTMDVTFPDLLTLPHHGCPPVGCLATMNKRSTWPLWATNLQLLSFRCPETEPVSCVYKEIVLLSFHKNRLWLLLCPRGACCQ